MSQFICISSDEDDDLLSPSIPNVLPQQVKSKTSPILSGNGMNYFLSYAMVY